MLKLLRCWLKALVVLTVRYCLRFVMPHQLVLKVCLIILFGIKEQYSLFSSPVTITPFFPQMLLIDFITLYTKQNYSFDTSNGSVFASDLDVFRRYTRILSEFLLKVYTCPK